MRRFDGEPKSPCPECIIPPAQTDPCPPRDGRGSSLPASQAVDAGDHRPVALDEGGSNLPPVVTHGEAMRDRTRPQDWAPPARLHLFGPGVLNDVELVAEHGRLVVLTSGGSRPGADHRRIVAERELRRRGLSS